MQPPDDVATSSGSQTRLTDLVEILSALLGRNVVGVCAAEPASAATAPALQLLVVIARDLRRDTKLELVQALLRR